MFFCLSNALVVLILHFFGKYPPSHHLLRVSAFAYKAHDFRQLFQNVYSVVMRNSMTLPQTSALHYLPLRMPPRQIFSFNFRPPKLPDGVQSALETRWMEH